MSSNRALLGDHSRVAARTITAFIRTTVGEPGLSVGIVASIQTHGSLANWHPHLHPLVTDGGFRPDGTFVRLPLHDVTTLTEAFRRAVLRLFGSYGVVLDRDIGFFLAPFDSTAVIDATGLLVPTGSGSWQLKPRSGGDVVVQ